MNNSRSAAPAATRRQALAALAALTAATTAACSGSSGASPTSAVPVRPLSPRPAESFANTENALLLQILAHPDDDLYFMNPDAEHMLTAGVPVVCVYVTAGEAAGINREAGTPRPGADKAAYSAARHQGLRQAYAQLLGLDKFTRWRRSVLELPGGVTAETNVLGNGGRSVRLVFLNIAMLSAGNVRIPQLWNLPGILMRTLIAADSPVRTPSTYRHQTLVDVLAGIMDRYRPTVIHTLDPDPDFQVHDATHPRDNDQPGCSDHRDHTPVALFAWKAIAQWADDVARREKRAPRFTVTSFRGYYNQRWPHNLPPAVVEQKARAVAAYGGSPQWDCGNAAGCGDYGQGGTRPLTNRKGWIRSTHYRYPSALPTPLTDPDGRLVAYGALGAQAVRWRETAPGSGRFGAPQGLGGGPLAPALCAVRDARGRHVLVALRFSALDGQGGANTRELVALEQRTPGGPFRAWTGLGTPDSDPEHGRRVGCPAAVATPDGRVHLFVRTADKGLATRIREAAGTWGPWQRLEGGEIQDGLTVLLDRQARVHVVAAGRDTVHYWAQDRPGDPVAYRPLAGLPRPGEQPGAVPSPDGSITLVYRPPAGAVPYVYSGGNSVPLRHFEGYGPVTAHALAASGGRQGPLLLLSRDLNGEVQVQYGTKPAAKPLRPTSRLVPVGTPTLLAGEGEQVRVVGMSPGATPWIWRPRATSRA